MHASPILFLSTKRVNHQLGYLHIYVKPNVVSPCTLDSILAEIMSSTLDLTGCKKRKRGDRIFKFKTFFDQGHPVDQFDGSFRHNVKALLEFGHLERNLSCRMPSWSFQLEVNRHPSVHVYLCIVEEPVEVSLNRHCKHCLHIGWGHHMICNKKYHFLVSSKETMVAACLGCEGSCDNGPGSEKDKLNLLELQGHIMHGVFHSNGFGHLLCVNGVEMGSDLAGHEIMDFWDRLCTGLRARKVSLFDISQKRGMDMRLLHGVAYNEPWFGRWGYEFGRGSFGVTQEMYQKAIKAIKATPLCLVINHLGPFNHEIPIIFSRYQILSDYTLVTLGDLFHFMLELESRLPWQTCINSYNPGILLETTCRWSPKRVEMATRVIVEALRRAEFRWVSRQEVRDMARAYIGDTGLLDFVLKSLGNQVVGNYLVRRSLNPVTKVLEYCLEDISNPYPNQEGSLMNNPKMKARYKITRVQLMKDIFCLYKYILKEQTPMINTAAARIILDTKYLMKEYVEDLPSRHDIVDRSKEKTKVCCSIMLKHNSECNDLIKKAMPPYECVSLKYNPTIHELKLEVEETFREIYWGLRNNFVVESLVNVNAKGSDLALELVEAGCMVVFEASTANNEGIYESSYGSRVVDCPCGTRNDDGERMVSCDICEVWQHTRCVRIPNSEQIPHIYICNRCEQDIIPFHSLP